MSKLRQFVKYLAFNKGSMAANMIAAVLLALLPEACFCCEHADGSISSPSIIVINRLVLFLGLFIMSNVVYGVYRIKRKKVLIQGDHRIQVEEGNLFDITDGKVVINLDECYTTTVGDAPADVKPDSICGQYLKAYPIDNMQELIDAAGVKPARHKSKYQGRICYEPGTIVPNGRFLLMAFTKLDENGVGRLTYDEYVSCLNLLWQQIDVHCGTGDVYLPVLGSGIVRFDRELNQQQLLDVMAGSYRLSSHKLKEQHTLHIVCRPRDGFSLNRVFGIE